MSSMKVERYYNHNSLRNFTYLLTSESGACYIIDPFEAAPLLKMISERGLKLQAVLNTHEHFDHVGGNEELRAHTGCEIWVHERAMGKIPGATHAFKDGQKCELADSQATLTFVDTPGHTFSHMCLLLNLASGLEAVFTGDTLFNAGVGNCHNGGDPATLFESVDGILAKLPDETLVYPGHDYMENNLRFTLSLTPANEEASEYLGRVRELAGKGEFILTTIGEERLFNTFFRLSDPALRSALSLDEASDKEVFIKLRSLRDRW